MKNNILAILLLLISTSVHAEWWDFSWVNPVEREDLTAYDHATEGSSTIIYNAVDASVRATLPPSQTTYSENFPPGCYGLALTATDLDGRESTWTPLQEWCILANPKPHTQFTATKRVVSTLP